MTTQQKNSGELSDTQLDDVSGGQVPVVKMDKITVTAKRSDADVPVVKMEKVVVAAKRETPDSTSGGVNVAGVENRKK